MNMVYNRSVLMNQRSWLPSNIADSPSIDLLDGESQRVLSAAEQRFRSQIKPPRPDVGNSASAL
jgi:hypothetical protein